jgi:hypothetical protein
MPKHCVCPQELTCHLPQPTRGQPHNVLAPKFNPFDREASSLCTDKPNRAANLEFRNVASKAIFQSLEAAFVPQLAGQEI